MRLTVGRRRPPPSESARAAFRTRKEQVRGRVSRKARFFPKACKTVYVATYTAINKPSAQTARGTVFTLFP
jgi:hypothetical protein